MFEALDFHDLALVRSKQRELLQEAAMRRLARQARGRQQRLRLGVLTSWLGPRRGPAASSS
jgi:hypothetical protein